MKFYSVSSPWFPDNGITVNPGTSLSFDVTSTGAAINSIVAVGFRNLGYSPYTSASQSFVYAEGEGGNKKGFIEICNRGTTAVKCFIYAVLCVEDSVNSSQLQITYTQVKEMTIS